MVLALRCSKVNYLLLVIFIVIIFVTFGFLVLGIGGVILALGLLLCLLVLQRKNLTSATRVNVSVCLCSLSWAASRWELVTFFKANQIVNGIIKITAPFCYNCMTSRSKIFCFLQKLNVRWLQLILLNWLYSVQQLERALDQSCQYFSSWDDKTKKKWHCTDKSIHIL